MPERKQWNRLKELMAEFGITDPVIINERKHICVEVTLPNGLRRHTAFSASPSDWRIEMQIRTQLRRLIKDNP